MDKINNSNDINLYSDTSFNSNTSENNYVINHFWKPNESVNRMVEKICITNNYIKNLEVGPGFVPFSLATHFIGCNKNVIPYTNIDIDNVLFPFVDKSFDFIYCRHVLEDIQNPDFALREIFRITKNGGYIETPSPLIEITKGVDGTAFASSYCGYIHHRYIVWSNIQKNEIYFLPKYSCILDNILNVNDESKAFLYHLINNYPVYWNNYFLFNMNINENPNIIMYKNGVNFNTKNGYFVTEYIELVSKAINESIENTNYFISNYKYLLL
jgi:SAM-dependent methyltransferase